MNEDYFNNEDYNLTPNEVNDITNTDASSQNNGEESSAINSETREPRSFGFVEDDGNYYNTNSKSEYVWNNGISEERLIDEDLLFLDAPRKKQTSWWLIVNIIIGIYFITSVFAFNIALTPFSVTGASMYPTLNEDDSEATNDVVYIASDTTYKVGDIVVMHADNYTNEETFYIKRVVATAGDTIQFVRADNHVYTDQTTGTPLGLFHLYLNGKMMKESYINDETTDSEYTMFLRLDINEEIYFNTINLSQIITVPENHVYLLGDNRRVSNDSKYFGCVNTNDIVGKVKIHRKYGENLFSALYNSIKNKYLFN